VADHGQGEAGVEQLAVGGDQGEEERAERHEDEPVGDADPGPLQHPGVTQRLGQQVLPTLGLVVVPTSRGSAEPHHAQDGADPADEQSDPDRRYGQGEDYGDDLHERLHSRVGQRCLVTLCPLGPRRVELATG
jgi:hypothetical protein